MFDEKDEEREATTLHAMQVGLRKNRELPGKQVHLLSLPAMGKTHSQLEVNRTNLVQINHVH